MLVEHVAERLERELEPVRLGLVAAEEHDRPAGRRRPRRERVDVDGVREDLPRPARLAEEPIGRSLAERALVDDVVGGENDAAQRGVELVRALARPPRIGDAVLVDDDPAPRRFASQRSGRRSRGR